MPVAPALQEVLKVVGALIKLVSRLALALDLFPRLEAKYFWFGKTNEMEKKGNREGGVGEN